MDAFRREINRIRRVRLQGQLNKLGVKHNSTLSRNNLRALLNRTRANGNKLARQAAANKIARNKLARQANAIATARKRNTSLSQRVNTTLNEPMFV
jgi:hypothetical protein